jgi:hypothetical protein
MPELKAPLKAVSVSNVYQMSDTSHSSRPSTKLLRMSVVFYGGVNNGAVNGLTG